MRISDLAKAAGTTPRAIRHYHRLGLLDEPIAQANAYRDYDFEALARLMRIRWLAAAGVPLGSISAILRDAPRADDSDDFLADIDALLVGVRAEQQRLSGQESRLKDLRDSFLAGGFVSPLPAPAVTAMHQLIAAAKDAPTRRALEQDLHMLEVVAIRGGLPPTFLDAYTQALSDPQTAQQALAMFTRFGALAGRPVGNVESEINALATELHTSPMIQTLLAEVEIPAGDDHGSPEISLEELVPDPAQRRVLTAVFELIAAEAQQQQQHEQQQHQQRSSNEQRSREARQ